VELGEFEADTIVSGDCRALLPRLPAGCAALAFADPPYHVGYAYGEDITDADMERVDGAWLVAELRRLARVVCITSGIVNVHAYPPADWMLAWHKPGSTGRNWSAGYCTWEPVLVYGRPDRPFWQDAIRLPDNLNHAPAGVRKWHPCPKPVRLLEWLIAGMTAPGDLVIDPFMGSGTTAVAAKRLGRRWWGCELRPDFAEAARRRVEETPAPLLVEDAGGAQQPLW
jgi:DNA modification methylase